MNPIKRHWHKLRKSVYRQWKELLLPKGFIRLGTRYGGWWLDTNTLNHSPLLIDCGLGEDISFPIAFLEKFKGHVIGVEPNPRSLDYCRIHVPSGMTIIPKAIWTDAGQDVVFHLPRPQNQLPPGADGVSGSLIGSHEYVNGGDDLHIQTTSFAEILANENRQSCDVLKIDIEGAEYELIDALIARNELPHANQLLIEFHHNVTHHTLDETQSTTQKIMDAGFDLIHTEGRNYIFRIKKTS